MGCFTSKADGKGGSAQDPLRAARDRQASLCRKESEGRIQRSGDCTSSSTVSRERLEARRQNLQALRAWLGTHSSEVDLIRANGEVFLVPRGMNPSEVEIPSSSSLTRLDSMVNPSKFQTFQGKDIEECQICLEGGSVNPTFRKLPCGHFFHAHCIDSWLSKSSCCPLCLMDYAESPVKAATAPPVPVKTLQPLPPASPQNVAEVASPTSQVWA